MSRLFSRCFLLLLLLTIFSAPAHANGVPVIYAPLNPSAVVPGGAGFTLTVSGTGFISSAVINWNGSPRTTTFISASQLAASIPASDIASASTPIITVTNPGSGGGTSNALNLQITNPASSTPFANNDISGPRNNLANVASGDFNGDGKPDLVTAIGSNVFVLPGNGDGTFGDPIASGGPGATISFVHVADLNGDGKPDLVLVTSTGTYIELGRGDGTFQLTGNSLSDAPLTMVIADFNSDGNLDLAYATISGIQVQLGNGDGSFRPGPFAAFTQPFPGYFALAAGDFNSDGRLDLLVSTPLPGSNGGRILNVYAGIGDGSFGVPDTIPGTAVSFSDGVPSVVVADFNGDGRLDFAYFRRQLVLGPPATGYLSILLGNGDFTFGVPYQLPPQDNLVGPLLAGDFNGDGKLDLLAGNQLFYGNGDGTLSPAGSAASPFSVRGVVAGDFNGDGKLDLISQVDGTPSDIRALLQLTPPPDFGGSLSPSSRQIVPGGSASFTVNVSALNGFTGDVSLNVTGLPSAVSASFSPNPVTGGSGASTLTLTASNSTPLGNYALTITGTSGSLSHSLSATLTVNSSLGDFTGTVQPNPQNVIAGNSATFTISVSLTGGYTGNVNLSYSGLPPGSSATLSPSTIPGASGTATLTVFTATSTPQNVYPITITATSGPLSHSTIANLGVRSSSTNWTAQISPSSQTVAVGGGTSYLITLDPGSNLPAFDLSYSVTGLPLGANALFARALNMDPTRFFSLLVSLPPGTQPGTYQLLVTAQGGGVIHQGVVTLTVTP